MSEIVLSQFDTAQFVGLHRRGFPPLPDHPTPPRTRRHPEAAGTICQCVAPAPCTVHPDDRPLVSAEPAWNTARPGSPIARATHPADRTDGHLPYRDDPGEVRYEAPPLRYLTNDELAAWTTAVLAEHNRRLPRDPRG